MSRLDVAVGEKTVFTAILAEGEGTALMADGRVSASYDVSGQLTDASLMVTEQLYGLQRAGKLVLPDDVVEKLREQMINGVRWVVSMTGLTTQKMFLVLTRTDIKTEYGYHLGFNSGIPYSIPGTDWCVFPVREGDRVGFQLGGVAGEKQTCWINLSLPEDVSDINLVVRMKMNDLKEMVFPGYELEPAKKKSGKKGDGGGD